MIIHECIEELREVVACDGNGGQTYSGLGSSQLDLYSELPKGNLIRAPDTITDSGEQVST